MKLLDRRALPAIIQRTVQRLSGLGRTGLLNVLILAWLVVWLIERTAVSGGAFHVLLVGMPALVAAFFSVAVLAIANTLTSPSTFHASADDRPPDAFSWLAVTLAYGLLAMALGYVALYLFVALNRIAYPFALEWVEGGSLEVVRRLLEGKPPYVEPTIDYVPFVYTPVYYSVSAVVSRITGSGFFPLRLVSFTATLICFGVLFWLVKRETGEWLSATLALGLFAATFKIGGAWFDLARIDMLALAFFALALYLIRFNISPGGYLLAGILITLSFQTKQSAITMFAPLLVYAYVVNRRAALVLASSVVAGIGSSVAYLNDRYDGWYSFYTFSVLPQHSLRPEKIASFLTDDLVQPLSIACYLAGFYFLYEWNASPDERRRRLFYATLIVGTVGTSWLQRMHRGGFVNTVIPTYFSLSILLGLAFHQFRRASSTSRAAVNFICGLQFATLWYDPMLEIPGTQDDHAVRATIASIEQIEGDVLLPDHPYLLTLAGKDSTAHTAAVNALVNEVRDISACEPCKALRDDYEEAIREQRYGAAIFETNVLTRRHGYALPTDFETYYSLKQLLPYADATGFRPATGRVSRPQFVFTRRSPP